MNWIIPNPRTNSRPRRQTPPDVGGGSSVNCPPTFRIVVVGNPTTGSFDIDLQIPESEDDELVSDTITLEWDMTAADLKTAVEAHSAWNAEKYEALVSDGPFPLHSLTLALKGSLKNKSIPMPFVSNITLAGGARTGVRVERTDCDGA